MLPQVDPLGRVYVTALGTPVSWNAGVGYDALGRMCTTILLGPNDQYVNGWRLDPLGRVVVDAASANLVYNRGLPFNNQAPINGTMARSIDAAPGVNDPYVNGIRVGAGGVYFTTAAIPPSGGGYVGPLDPYTAGLLTAMSFRQLLSRPPMLPLEFRVTRASDSTSQFFGFTPSGGIDNAAIAAFCGASDGTLYEFCNQAQHLTHSDYGVANAAAAGRPLVYTAGAGLSLARFDGSTDVLVNTTAVPATPAYTIFFRGNLRLLTGVYSLLELGATYGSINGLAALWEQTPPRLTLGVTNTTGGNTSYNVYNGKAPSNNVQCWRFDRAQAVMADKCALFVNGVKQTPDALYPSGSVTGNFTSDRFFLGARSGGTQPAPLDAHTLVIYNTALSDAQIATISGVIAALPATAFLEEMSVAHELTVGINPAGTRVGYRKNEWGDWQPDDIPSLTRLFTNLGNDRLVVQAEGDKSALVVSNIHIVRFSPLTIFDFGPPNSVIFDGVQTDFTWIVPGFDFVLGENYEVSLS